MGQDAEVVGHMVSATFCNNRMLNADQICQRNILQHNATRIGGW